MSQPSGEPGCMCLKLAQGQVSSSILWGYIYLGPGERLWPTAYLGKAATCRHKVPPRCLKLCPFLASLSLSYSCPCPMVQLNSRQPAFMKYLLYAKHWACCWADRNRSEVTLALRVIAFYYQWFMLESCLGQEGRIHHPEDHMIKYVA